MNIADFNKISSYYDSKNTIGWLNTLSRSAAFPIDKWSVFGSYDAAKKYVNGEDIPGMGDSSNLAYDGQLIAVVEADSVVAYAIDSKAVDGLRRVGQDSSVVSSMISAICEAYRDELDVESISASTGKIFNQVWEIAGKISADFRDLEISEVKDLSTKLDSIDTSALAFETSAMQFDEKIDGVTDEIASVSSDLGDAICRKCWVGKGDGEGNIDGVSADISVITLTNKEFNEIAKIGLPQNTVLLIDDTYWDARGQVIKNVADPVDLSDAIAKKWVEDRFLALSGGSLTGDLSTQNVEIGPDSTLSVGNESKIYLTDRSQDLGAYVSSVASQTSSYALDEAKKNAEDYMPLSGGDIYGDISISGQLSVNGNMVLDYHKKDADDPNAQFVIRYTDISVVNGNYTQGGTRGDGKTETEGIPGEVYNFSFKNSFLQADEAFSGSGNSYGPASTGSKCYCILSVDASGKRLKLSGDIETTIASHLGKLWSISLQQAAETTFTTLESYTQETSAGWVVLNNMPSNIAKLSTLSEDELIDLFTTDDNAFYTPIDPRVGNLVPKNFYGCFSSGGSTKAIGKYSHAEGRCTIADVRYSHAEGSFSFAGGMASHAEGTSVSAFGSSSHAEGQNSKAYGTTAHAEGNAVSAFGAASHAEGEKTQAIGADSHAEGCMTSADANYAHAEGYRSNASGTYAHAEGLSSFAIGEGSHAEGKANYAIAPFGHAEGDGYCYAGTMAFNIITSDIALSTLTLDTLTCDAGSLADAKLKDKWIVIFQRAKTDGNVDATFRTKYYGIVPGHANTISVSYVPNFAEPYKDANIFFPDYPLYGTVSLGSGAHAHGYQSHAMEDATAFGCNNFALGRYSFALGNANKTDYMGIAIGSGNGAFGSHSIAMGGNGSATSDTLDSNTQVYASKAFGWSGNGKYELPAGVLSAGGRNGTFNVNPIGGANGFFIGNSPLPAIIKKNACSELSAMFYEDDGTTKITDPANVKLINVITALSALYEAGLV